MKDLEQKKRTGSYFLGAISLLQTSLETTEVANERPM